MSQESQENPEIEVPAAEASGLGPSLRAARMRMGLEIEDAAKQLRLSPRQLAALESEDFAALPSPTFIRGFLRNYARLLQLDPEPLLAMYAATLPGAGAAATITLASEGIPLLSGRDKTWVPYVAASVLLGIALGGWWTYMDWRNDNPVPPPAAKAVQPVPAQPLPPQPEPVVTAQPIEMPAAQPAPEQPMQGGATPAAEPAPAVPAQVGTNTVNTPPAVTGQGRVGLQFTKQSWVRVLDRDGHELLKKNCQPGSEETIDGAPPFKLDIGNAGGVQLVYNGKPVDLAPYTRANVARLTLE